MTVLGRFGCSRDEITLMESNKEQLAVMERYPNAIAPNGSRDRYDYCAPSVAVTYIVECVCVDIEHIIINNSLVSCEQIWATFTAQHKMAIGQLSSGSI